MGVTLDQLLASSGISALGGATEKVASDQNAQTNDEDLVSALRKYAESKEEPNVKAAAAQELAEKTAEILVIKKTLEEIEKVAELGIETNRVAAFIKTALDKGYSEEQIAAFLKQAAGRLGRGVGYLTQRLARGEARAAERTIERVSERELRLLRDTIKRGKPGEIAKRLDELEGKLGKDQVETLVSTIKSEGTYIPTTARGYLPRGGGKKISVESGGKKLEFEPGKHKWLWPGVGVAGGFTGAKLMGGKSHDEGSGGGKRPVTVIQ